VDPISTVGDAIAVARLAYDDLTALAEDVEDEWSYVNDLAAAWIERMDAVADARGQEPAAAGVVASVPALAAEVALLDDPHRAIDWLSTFPQVLLIALGERP
jgi:hypothetical protein